MLQWQRGAHNAGVGGRPCQRHGSPVQTWRASAAEAKAGGDIYRLSRDPGHSSVDVADRTYAGWIRHQDRQAVKQDPGAKAVARREKQAPKRIR